MGPLRAVRKRHVWLLAPFVALVSPLSRTIGDNSFLWHVRAGTVQLDAGEVLRTDPFSYVTEGSAWRTQSWLAELGYGYLERTFDGVGWAPAVVLVAIVTAGLLSMRRSDRLGATLPFAVALGLLIALQAFVFAVPRPVLLSYPLLAAVALLIDDDDGELWLGPLIIWLWAALHGSFVLGVGLLVLDALRRRNGRRALAAGLAVVAASLTAHGVAIWQILIDFAQSRETLALIEEWSRSDPRDARLLPFFIVFAVLVVGGALRRISLRDLTVAVPFALFGLLAVRNVFPALLVVGPTVAAFASTLIPIRERPEQREPAALNVAILAVVASLLLLAALQPHSLRAERFPTPPVVRALDEGRIFHNDAVGGYLIWAVGPETQVYIDDRAELYGEARFRQMRTLLDGEGDLADLSDLGATQALVGREEGLVGQLKDAGWMEAASDEYFVLLRASVP